MQENIQDNRKKKHKKKTDQKRNIKAKIVAATVILTAAAGLCFVVLYAFGGARLRATAGADAPDAALLTDGDAAEEIRRAAGLGTLQWQDNWIAMDGKVYAYEESCINLLVLGLDKEGKISGKTDFEKWGEGQADAIFVVSINPVEEEFHVIGIPRNTMMDIDIYDREGHIAETRFDAACLQYPYAGGGKPGLEKTKEKISALLYGLPIHGAVAVGYSAISRINDMVGGVDVVALESLKTKKYGSYKEGEKLHLEGDLVLAYVKERNMEVQGSPTLRMKRQKQYLTALLNKVKEKLKKNPALAADMYKTASKYMLGDLTLDKAVYLAAQASGYRFGEDSIRLLQGENRTVPIIKDGKDTGDYYDEYYLDEENLKKTMTEVFYKEVVLNGKG